VQSDGQRQKLSPVRWPAPEVECGQMGGAINCDQSDGRHQKLNAVRWAAPEVKCSQMGGTFNCVQSDGRRQRLSVVLLTVINCVQSDGWQQRLSAVRWAAPEVDCSQMGSTKNQNARGSVEAEVGSEEALQSLSKGLPHPIYPSLHMSHVVSSADRVSVRT